MSITTKNSLPAGTTDPSGNTENRPGLAAGVEIPVVVHASRYSASASSLGKTLPAVHEETRTVIVFEQGAVVRLTALMVVGEVVVLTNKQSGADVICKVTSVKAQPGIQNYVSLEFTQRALGFWGASAPSASSASAVAPAQEPSVAPPPAPAPLAAQAPPAIPQPARIASPAAMAPPPSPVVLPTPEPVPSTIAEPVETAFASSPFAAASGKALKASPTFGLAESSSLFTNARPIELAVPSTLRPAEGKNLPLIAIAAAALLVVGGVGGWLLMRPRQQPAAAVEARLPDAAVAPPAAASQPQPSSESTVATDSDANLPPATPSAEPLPASSRESGDLESSEIQPAVSRPASEVPRSANISSVLSLSSAKASVSAPPAPEEHKAAIDVTQMRAPSVKKAAGATIADAPPDLPPQAQALPGSSLNDSLLPSANRSTGLTAPAPPAPSRGEQQLVQPKLITAPPPVYPVQARAQRVEGDVAVDAFIDETGKVVAVKVITGPPQLQQAALNAVRAWTYQPARLDGLPIPVHSRVTVSFHLR